MALAWLPQFLASYPSAPQGSVLEVDDTEAPVHGGQEHARDDSYEGGYCFLPLQVSEGLSGRLRTTRLQAKRLTGAQMLAVWKRLGKRLRQGWPHPLVIGRGDRHFASPEGRPWSAAQPFLGSVPGLPRNVVLQAWAREVGEPATRADALSGHKGTRFHSTRYQAGTWARPRRVVSKVEVSEQGINTRFVGTALEQARPKVRYQKIYWARGQAEHASKDHTLSWKSDRPSCPRFEAQQWRVLLHAAADGLLETLRREV